MRTAIHIAPREPAALRCRHCSTVLRHDLIGHPDGSEPPLEQDSISYFIRCPECARPYRVRRRARIYN